VGGVLVAAGAAAHHLEHRGAAGTEEADQQRDPDGVDMKRLGVASRAAGFDVAI